MRFIGFDLLLIRFPFLKNVKKLRLFLTVLFATLQWVNTVLAKEYTLLEDISYYVKGLNDSYQKERFQLGVYYSKRVMSFPIVIWFHGGGLKAGHVKVKHIVLEGYRNGIQHPALPLVIKEINQLS
jgi:hypothetical protein